LEWGRHELELLRPRVSLAVGVSAFNADDLLRYGYERVEVVPVGLDPTRLHDVAPDSQLAADLAERFPAGYALWVSQVLPHKRLELLVGAMHLLRWVHQHELGVVIAGSNRLPSYWDAMHAYARRLNVPRILFTGVVSDGALSTLFRRAELFVTTSAHEGLGLPPIEAMSFGLPVITTGAGALADTVGDGGIVLPADAGPVTLAEAMVAVLDEPQLRCDLVRRGFRRSAELRRAGSVERFIELLEAVR
jgi:glycosyltransferase involved in cell wall biosynthesis